MSYAPALRDIESKFLCKLFRSLAGDGISPGPKRYHKVSCFIKYHVAVHHSRKTDAGELLDAYSVFRLNVLFKVGVAVLKSCPYIIQRVCPYSVLKSVFPLMTALCYGVVVLIYKYRLDPGRTKLDTKYTFAALNTFCCIHFYILLK